MKEKKPLWNPVEGSQIIGVILNPQKSQTPDKSIDDAVQIPENETQIIVPEPDAMFEAFDNPIPAMAICLVSWMGYERMKRFLNGTMLDDKIPIIEYQELDIKNPFEPILPGFDKNRRIIVKCAKSIKYSFNSAFGKMSNGDIFESYIELERQTEYLFRRDYDFNPDTFRLMPCRTPIFLSGKRKGIDKFAGLAFEIMTHQLEPVTSKRINYCLRNNWRDISKQGLINLVALGLYEEAVIATGVARYWLNSAAQNHYSPSEIGNFNPYEVNNDDAELSFLQAQRSGINGILDFYKSKEWDIIDYLNGRF